MTTPNDRSAHERASRAGRRPLRGTRTASVAAVLAALGLIFAAAPAVADHDHHPTPRDVHRAVAGTIAAVGAGLLLGPLLHDAHTSVHFYPHGHRLHRHARDCRGYAPRHYRYGRSHRHWKHHRGHYYGRYDRRDRHYRHDRHHRHHRYDRHHRRSHGHRDHRITARRVSRHDHDDRDRGRRGDRERRGDRGRRFDR